MWHRERDRQRDSGTRFGDWRQRGTETMRHREREREGHRLCGTEKEIGKDSGTRFRD